MEEAIGVTGLTPLQRKLWRRAIADLRVLCPTKKLVRVKVYPMDDGDWGECFGHKASFAIHITRKLFKLDCDPELSMARETLAHEWAHAVVWDYTHSRESNDHSHWWGVAYADCYRAVFDRWED